MCIIVIKPAGQKVTKKILENCFENNSDGAGFMYPLQGQVQYQKGFMTFPEFWDAWSETRDKLSLNRHLVVFHFRIATAGEVSPGQCHPFPITSDIQKMQETQGQCNMAIAHNGILLGWGQGDISDTMELVRDVLSLPAVQRTITYPKVQELITRYINGSKIAILQGNGNLITLGEGWVEKKGLQFSNHGYKKPPKFNFEDLLFLEGEYSWERAWSCK